MVTRRQCERAAKSLADEVMRIAATKFREQLQDRHACAIERNAGTPDEPADERALRELLEWLDIFEDEWTATINDNQEARRARKTTRQNAIARV